MEASTSTKTKRTPNSYTHRFTALGLDYDALSDLDEASLNDLFVENSQTEKHWYEYLSTQFVYIEKELTKPGCTLQTLWKEYLTKDSAGYHYTQFTYYYRRWRGRQKISGKLEHKAGYIYLSVDKNYYSVPRDQYAQNEATSTF